MRCAPFRFTKKFSMRKALKIAPSNTRRVAAILTWLQEYLRINTTNPPGHEMRAVSFYKKILDEEGIENRAFEYTSGRGDLDLAAGILTHKYDKSSWT